MRIGGSWRLVGAALLLCGSPRISTSPGQAMAQVLAKADSTYPSFARAGLYPYRSNPDSAEVAKIVAEWQAAGGPRKSSDHVSLAALWRRAGETELALRALAPVRVGSTSHPRAELERARIIFAEPLCRSPGDPAEIDPEVEDPASRRPAAAAFWRACERMNAAVKREIWLDIRGLATPDEQEEWRRVPALPSSCAWVRNFLKERAWRAGLTIDERLALHYRRLTRARAEYWIRRPSGPADMADQLGRPDSLEVDDRGLVYLRMGEPDKTASYLGFDAENNVTWAYYGVDPARFYHFSPVSRMNRALFTPGGWDHVRSEIGAPIRALVPLSDYRMIENLWWVGGEMEYVYLSRMPLGGRFGGLAFLFVRLRFGMASPLQMQMDLGQERADNWADAAFVIRTVPDIPALERKVRFAYEFLRFQDPGRAEADVWVLASARGRDLRADERPDAFLYEAGISFTAATPTEVIKRETSRQLAIRNQLGKEDGVPLRLRARLPPGVHRYTLVVRDEQTEAPQVGNWLQAAIIIPGVAGNLPEVSDIAVASDSGGTWTRDGHTFLNVTPDHVVSSEGLLHVYFEIYGLKPAAVYEVEIRMVKEKQRDEMYEAPPTKAAFTLSFKDVMATRRQPVGRHYLRLDLSETRRGTYALGVRVLDLAAGTYSLPRVTLITR